MPKPEAYMAQEVTSEENKLMLQDVLLSYNIPKINAITKIL